MEDSGSKLCTEVLTLLPSSRFPGSWFIAQPPSHTFMQWHFGFASHLQWPHRSGFAPDSLFTSTVRPVRMHLIVLWNYTYLCYHSAKVQSTPIWFNRPVRVHAVINPFTFYHSQGAPDWFDHPVCFQGNINQKCRCMPNKSQKDSQRYRDQP